MADKDPYDDEYQFSDLDVIDSDSSDTDESTSEADSSSKTQAGEGRKNIRRNALIVVGTIILALLAYKFLGSFFSSKSKQTEKVASVPPLTAAAPQPTAFPQEQPVTPPPAVVVQPNAENSQISQKLAAVEMGQQSVRSDVNSMNSQLGGINTTVNELTGKIATLSQMLSVLTSKVDRQSREIVLLTERARPRPVHHRVVRRGSSSRRTYYIQAVIPGRAWLIATNGSTLTVREGTVIAGYGVVKLIDPNQGRVVTSSGQVIRFSQQDS